METIDGYRRANTAPVVRLGPGGDYERNFHEDLRRPGRLVEMEPAVMGEEDLRRKRGLLRDVIRELSARLAMENRRLVQVERELARRSPLVDEQ